MKNKIGKILLAIAILAINIFYGCKSMAIGTDDPYLNGDIDFGNKTLDRIYLAARANSDEYYGFNAEKLLQHFTDRMTSFDIYYGVEHYNMFGENVICVQPDVHTQGYYQTPTSVMTCDGLGNVTVTTVDVEGTWQVSTKTTSYYSGNEMDKQAVKFAYKMAYYAMRSCQLGESYIVTSYWDKDGNPIPLDPVNDPTRYKSLMRFRGFMARDDLCEYLGVHKKFWAQSRPSNYASGLEQLEREAETIIDNAFNGQGTLPEARFMFMQAYDWLGAPIANAQNDLMYAGRPGQQPPKVVISKQDKKTGEALGGAIFLVKNKNGESIGRAITNSSGQFTWYSGKIGETYTIEEITAPAGYYKTDPVSQTITLKSGVNNVQFYDYNLADDITITVVKEDPITQEPVPNARFRIWRYDLCFAHSAQLARVLYKENAQGNGYEPLTIDEYPPTSVTPSRKTYAGMPYVCDQGSYEIYSSNFYSQLNNWENWRTAGGSRYFPTGQYSAGDVPYVSCTYYKVKDVWIPPVGEKEDEDYKPGYWTKVEYGPYSGKFVVPSEYRGSNYWKPKYARAYLQREGNAIGEFHKRINPSDDYVAVTDETGTITASASGGAKLEMGRRYYAQEIEPAPDGYLLYKQGQEFVIGVATEQEHRLNKVLQEATPRGNLIIEKRDEDTNELMDGIGFYVYHETKGWLTMPGTGMEPEQHAVYTQEQKGATEFFTGMSGQGTIKLNYLEVGKYTVFEDERTLTGKYEGYKGENQARKEIVLTVNDQNKYQAQTFTLLVQNRQTYLPNLEGYVWLDEAEGKISVRNDLWDPNETRLEGIRVTLVAEKNGEVDSRLTRQTLTDANGYFSFQNVEVALLNGEDDTKYTGIDFTGFHCYLTFDYDGLTYQAVKENVNAENGSKAKEVDGTRDALNAKFARVDGIDGVNNKVQAKDKEGRVSSEVTYKLKDDATAEVESATNTNIQATTEGVIEIRYPRGQGIKTLSGYNLGVYKRDQIDVALVKDLEQVDVGLKGAHHIYKYNSLQSSIDDTESEDQIWDNVGVAFRKKYGAGPYLQPIYRADATYVNSEDNSNELQVVLTYKIALKNQAGRVTQINGVTDYFDSRYTLKEVFTELDPNTRQKVPGTEITGEENLKQGKASDDYQFVDINTNIVLEEYKNQYLYVQLELGRQNIVNALNGPLGLNKEITEMQNLKNIAEITSYTVYEDFNAKKTYASVDKDAVLDNVVLGDENTYEDDTREAFDVGLVLADARSIEGYVFEDKEIQALLDSANIREGDGKYDSSESMISNVKVELLEQLPSGEIVPAENIDPVITGDEGTYRFEGYTPGTYFVRFTWGWDNETGNSGSKIVKTQTLVDAVNYKSTIIVDGTLYTNPRWYQVLPEDNLSHAVDNWDRRLEIDRELNDNGNGYDFEVNLNRVKAMKMDSSTENMTFGVEYEDTDLDIISEYGDKLQFALKGINFGIIERPHQNMEMEKRVANVKLIYSNNEVIVNADVDTNGILTGEANYTTYVGTSTNRRGAQIKIEVDEEVLKNSEIQVIYDYEISNNSEQDYTSKEFYYYGQQIPNKGDPVRMAATRIMDYLGIEGTYMVRSDINAENKWQLVEKSAASGKISPKVLTDGSEAIEETTMYETEKLKNTRLAAGEKTSVEMEVERRLSSTEEDTNDKNLINQVEIVSIDKPFGSELIDEHENTITPGNYIPTRYSTNYNHEDDDSTSEQILVISNQGGNRSYVVYITIGIVALAAVAGGIYAIIRKKKE